MGVKNLIISGCITVTCAMTSVALAEQAAFSTLDANGDSYISAEEADKNPALKDNWDAVDTNKDGMVEQAEFSAFEEKAPEPGK